MPVPRAILYSSLAAFGALLVIAVVFTPSFMQRKEEVKGAHGCPAKCCKACALNWLKVLLFAVLAAAVVGGIAAAVHRPTRERGLEYYRRHFASPSRV